MAKRMGCLVLVAALGAGCGGGGGPAAAQGLAALPQELIDCLRDRNLNLFRLLAGVARLFEAAAGADALPRDVTVFEPTVADPDVYDFVLQLDLDGDGANDSTASGQFRVADGSFDVFSGFELSWMLDAGSLFMGDGGFDFVFLGDNRFEMTGDGRIATPAGDCAADLAFAAAAPFTLTLPLELPLRRVAGNVGGANFVGGVRALVDFMGDIVDVTLGFAEGTQVVTGTDITLNGEPGIQPFVYSLPDVPAPVIDAVALLDCARGHLDQFAAFIDAAIALAEAVQADGRPPDGITFEPSDDRFDPPFTYDYTAALGDTGVTAAGKITFSADPSDLLGETAMISIDLMTRDGAAGGGDMTIEFGLLGPQAFGTLAFTLGACTTTLTIREQAKLALVGGSDLQGTMTAEVRSQPGIGLDLTVDLPAGDGAVLTGQTTNGDPVPRTTIVDFP